MFINEFNKRCAIRTFKNDQQVYVRIVNFGDLLMMYRMLFNPGGEFHLTDKRVIHEFKKELYNIPISVIELLGSDYGTIYYDLMTKKYDSNEGLRRLNDAFARNKNLMKIIESAMEVLCFAD